MSRLATCAALAVPCAGCRDRSPFRANGDVKRRHFVMGVRDARMVAVE